MARLRRLDELSMAWLFLGSRRMAAMLAVNRKRVQQRMRLGGIVTLWPKPRHSRPAPGHEIHPRLLRGMATERPNRGCTADITSVPMRPGLFCLMAGMDWFSRSELSWEFSPALDTCIRFAVWKPPCARARRRFSTRAKVRNSLRPVSPPRCGTAGSGSAWTAAAAGRTVFSSSRSGSS